LAKKRPKISEATRKKMSEAGKHMSEEHRKKISESKMGAKNPMFGKPSHNRGKSPSLETRKKLSEAQKGKKLSEEHKKKISEAGKGRKISEATRKKMSESQKGKKHSEATRKKLSENAKNISKEHRKKMSESHKNLSAESRKNMSKSWDSPEMKELARKHLREIRHNQVKPNKPELKVKNILIESKIEFSMFVNVKYSHLQHEADFLIKPNKIIEFNGTYSHADPRKYKPDHKIWNKIAKDVWERDKKIIDGMKQQGYKVLVVWEQDLLQDTENTTKKILRFAKS
jgi:G:T-mismatch repair DNA endonuclease (very short patch repair protein)